MSEKKVLIITYYWPPSGGSGVQRWLKFVKYLPAYGYTPYVFTPENPSFDLKDESLMADVPAEAEVIRFPIWEPYQLFSEVTGKKKTTNVVRSEKKSLLWRVAIWLRGNFIIPDPRVFWVRPSVRFLHDFLRDQQIRLVITTGPPHSVHLIGLKLKQKNPSIKWVADFRDPWSTWGLLDSLKVGKMARAMHRRMERNVLQTADRVVTITPFYVKKFTELSGRKVDLLTNGFDESDFSSLSIRRTVKYVIRHVGIVNEKCNPRPFMQVVRSLVQSNADFASSVEVNFIGDIHPEFVEYVKQDAVLKGITSFTTPVPHKELMEYYGTSSLLLLILTGYKDAEGYMPGKLFEYIATGLPVLGVGPVDGDAGQLITAAGAGSMIDSDDHNAMVKFLLESFSRWKNPGSAPAHRNTASFSRKGITGTLAKMLDSL